MKLFSGSAKQAAGWQQTIDSAALPDAIKQMIREVTRRSRLWTGEKRAVAQELIGHFEDGLEAGRTAGDLIHTFGDVKVSAKLIRLSMRRKRPWWWQMQRRMQQAALALIAFYAGLWALLAMDHPQPKVDYLAMYNAAADQVPEQDKAWPIYRKAIIESEYAKLDVCLDILYPPSGAAERRHSRIHPADEGWDKIEPYLLRYQPLIQALRIGATKPVLGNHIYRDVSQFSSQDRKVYGLESVEQKPSSMDGSRMEYMDNPFAMVDLRHLALMRSVSNWLVTDMVWAEYQNDGDRILADYQALVGISRQLHQPHSPVIEQLVSLSIIAMAHEEMNLILFCHPEVLSDDQLHRVCHESHQLSKWEIYVSTEQQFMFDMIQRIYSDDGRGNGRLTLKAINNNDQKPWLLLQPFFVMMAYSRSEAEKSIKAWENDFTALQNRSIRQMVQMNLPTDPFKSLFWNPQQPTILGFSKNPVLQAMTMGLTSVAVTFNRHKTHCESIATAAAMELYHRKHGRYPDAIGDLVPEYLPTHPIDRSTGEPLRYQQADGKPLLYGCGLNGVDDGGVMSRQGLERWPNVPDDGDWILFPPPRREPYRP